MTLLAQIASSLLLFGLVFGMSATVDLGKMSRQVRNLRALAIGISMQFLILPLVGFVSVKAFNLSTAVGTILLVITSSPGGSYSNWWCSLFNAELALSVTMTGVSTLLSLIMLPANLMLYTQWTYSADIVDSLDWPGLLISLCVVLGGIASGLLCGSFYQGDPRFHKRANRLGNSCGLSLIALSAILTSSQPQGRLWDRDARFYIGVGLPAVIGCLVATRLAIWADLDKPERVAVTIESCYQNTGIATSLAWTMFNGSQRAQAVGVPLFYGIVEMVVLGVYCVVCWKKGWTKAPPDENLCVVLLTSYECEDSGKTSQADSDGGVNGQNGHSDLVFCQTERGDAIMNSGTTRQDKHYASDNGHIEDFSVTETASHDDESPRNTPLSAASPSSRAASAANQHSLDSEVPTSLNQSPLEISDSDKDLSRMQVLQKTMRARAKGYRQPNSNARWTPWRTPPSLNLALSSNNNGTESATASNVNHDDDPEVPSEGRIQAQSDHVID
jgi:predicted Na+-dependent transporter